MRDLWLKDLWLKDLRRDNARTEAFLRAPTPCDRSRASKRASRVCK